MESNVFLDDKNIIEMNLVGERTFDMFSEMFQKAFSLAEVQKDNGSKVLFLVDYSKAASPNETNVSLTKRGIDQVRYDKIAFVGTDPNYKETIQRALVHLTDLENIKYFDKKEDAINWLLS